MPDDFLGKSYRIHDASGRLVHQAAFKQTYEKWELMLSAGVYTVQVEGQRALRWVVR